MVCLIMATPAHWNCSWLGSQVSTVPASYLTRLLGSRLASLSIWHTFCCWDCWLRAAKQPWKRRRRLRERESKEALAMVRQNCDSETDMIMFLVRVEEEQCCVGIYRRKKGVEGVTHKRLCVRLLRPFFSLHGYFTPISYTSYDYSGSWLPIYAFKNITNLLTRKHNSTKHIKLMKFSWDLNADEIDPVYINYCAKMVR